VFEISRRHQLIILIIAAVLIFGGGYRYALWQQGSSLEKPVLEQPESRENPAGEGEMLVHVAGAVEKPGVYRLSPGARVQDAIKMAVALPEADLDILNLAAPLTDGQKIVVPLKQAGNDAVVMPGQGLSRPAPVSATSSGNPFARPVVDPRVSGSGGSLVNINTASQEELETLPGIGPSLAQRIIQYRETSGPFKVPEDIKNVSGIGEKRYEQLKDYITVY
jgi:competence protein ComEA